MKTGIKEENHLCALTQFANYLENTAKQAKVKDYEKEIDKMVYELYGLSETEIKIVDSEKMKPIRLSAHAKEQLYFRGTTETEVIETIETSEWIEAKFYRHK